MNRQGNTNGRSISGFTDCSPPHIDTGHIVEILVLLNALVNLLFTRPPHSRLLHRNPPPPPPHPPPRPQLQGSACTRGKCCALKASPRGRRGGRRAVWRRCTQGEPAGLQSGPC